MTNNRKQHPHRLAYKRFCRRCNHRKEHKETP